MHATNVVVERADAGARREGGFQRVLLDPPCSGLGTLASRPDRRWRAQQDSSQLVHEQARLLSAAAAALDRGGLLVYSTCTIAPPENEQMIDAFLDAHSDFEPVDLQHGFPGWAHPGAERYLLALPHVQGSDGFFIAAMRRP
jgi:16S rRNA (cytosine967-C5)-methyltransferase